MCIRDRGVIDQERSKGVKIFARNTLGRGYRLTDAYDIGQTQGRDLKKVQLKDDSKEMSIALRAILNLSLIHIWTNDLVVYGVVVLMHQSGTKLMYRETNMHYFLVSGDRDWHPFDECMAHLLKDACGCLLYTSNAGP